MDIVIEVLGLYFCKHTDSKEIEYLREQNLELIRLQDQAQQLQLHTFTATHFKK